MEDSQRKIIGSVIGLIVFIMCIASLTFAYYSWRSANKIVDMGIHDGGIKYVYSNTNNLLTSNSIDPVTTYNNLSNSLLYTDYTATNTTKSYPIHYRPHIIVTK